MAKTRHPLQALETYLPPNTFDPVAVYIQQYKVHLTITRERKSILGNYRNAHASKNHRITVNGNLNRFSFLITLLHEMAHLLTFEQYGHRVQPHGREWKQVFGNLLASFIQKKIFPHDLEQELISSLANPAASSCAEEGLMRILRRYDAKTDGLLMVEEVPFGSMFRLKDGRVFKKGEKLRKRYRGEEVGSARVYLFSPVYEVELIAW
jgi:hypothetical protein